MTMVDLINDYHDLKEHFERQESYHDFEGFADMKKVFDKCRDPRPQDGSGKYIWDLCMEETDPRYHVVRSVFLGQVYEMADCDCLGDDVTFETISYMFEIVMSIFGCRWWSKVTDEQIKEVEQWPYMDDEAKVKAQSETPK